MKIVSRNAAKAMAERFIPVPAVDVGPTTDFAQHSPGRDQKSYLRPLTAGAHEWLLVQGRGYGTWVHGRMYQEPEITVRLVLRAMRAGFSVSHSNAALPPRRPKLKIVNRVIAAGVSSAGTSHAE